MLEVRDLQVAYGAAPALWGVSLDVRAGEMLCVVGPNGAGKSTLIHAIAGILRAGAGRIVFEGNDITRLPPHRFCEAGIAIVPEGRRLFTGMTVLENLELGCRSSAARTMRRTTLDWVFQLFPLLAERQRQLAGTLSGGEQQMCAIGRGLMARPRLLMLDEPSLGLAPVMVRTIFEILARINQEGMTILLVEQNVLRSLQLSHRGYVIENGRITIEGSGADLLASPHIKQAYLGV